MKAGICLLAVLAGTVASRATLLTHSTSGTLFNDTFEGQTPGVAPVGANASPGGNGETWNAAGAPVTLANPSGPGAYEGNQYAQLDTSGELLGAEASSFVSSGILTVQFAAYVGSQPAPAGTRVRMRFKIDNDISYNLTWDTANNDMQDNGGEIGLSFLRDTWQEYTVVYNYNTTGAGMPNDDTVTITVDGNTSGPRATDLQNTSIDEVDWRLVQTSDIAFYIDAIPEPAGLALFGIGATLLAVARRRATRAG